MTHAAPPKKTRLVVAQPRRARPDLPGAGAGADRRSASGSWPTTPCRTCRCAASRAASTSSPGRPASTSARPWSPTTPAESVLEGLSGRRAQHAARGHHRHRADHAAGHAGGRGALLAQRAGARPVLRLRGAVPQRAGPAAAADVVPVLRPRCCRSPGGLVVAGCSFSARAAASFPVPVWARGHAWTGRRCWPARRSAWWWRRRVGAVRGHRPGAQPLGCCPGRLFGWRCWAGCRGRCADGMVDPEGRAFGRGRRQLPRPSSWRCCWAW
jgi:hypothetical protein